MSKIHVLGRLVLPTNGHILLARKVGQAYSYLPGGHVEHGESVKQALQREIQEELGKAVEVWRFVAALEHSYEKGGEIARHEVNFIFMGRLPGYNLTKTPKPIEANLEFFWHPVDKLKEVNLQPSPLIHMLWELYEMGATLKWASTMDAY